MRRCKWIRRSSINYETSPSNEQTDQLNSLVQCGFLQDSKNSNRRKRKTMKILLVSSLDDLDSGLRLLTAEEMRDFSKRFHCQSKADRSKKTSIENLKSLTNQYQCVFNSSTATNRNHILIKELVFSSFEISSRRHTIRFRLKRIIGNCFKISEEIRGLFFRMMLVYHPVALLAMDDLDQNAFTLL